MSEIRKVSRREFIALTGSAGTGLWLAIRLAPAARAAAAARFQPNAFLAVDESGDITIWVAKSEMGQGVRTSLPMIVAEELEADWTKVRIEPAIADPKYGSMLTGGSTSVRTGWEPLRNAGAAAREMLVSAAAAEWGVDRKECRAEGGSVLGPGGRLLGFGALAARAATFPVPRNPPLKDPKNYRLIGKPLRRLDTADKVTGRAVFGMDVNVPGMLYAAVARSPVWGGQAARFDAAKARAVRGVRGVHAVPSGVAVVADSIWPALQGRAALAVTWDEGPNAQLDSAEVRRRLEAALSNPAGTARKDGEGAVALRRAARRIEALYELPFLAHATMEPMNCTAHVRAGGAEIWAPTQAPQWAQEEVAKALGVPAQKVVVHTTLLGGGFGRRSIPDFVLEAAHVSKAAGAPVKVVWTREDDMGHDRYRPASLHRLSGGLDASGRVVAWAHRLASPSISHQIFALKEGAVAAGARRVYEGARSLIGRLSFSHVVQRPDVVEGAWDLPYAIPAVEVQYAIPDIPVPVGWWRSVYSSQTAFANECFLDELAASAMRDPVALRRELLAKEPRLAGALVLAAEKAGWGKPLPAGRARGVACHSSFGSQVAEVAEVSVQGGKVRVHRVVAAVDCGRVIHPDAAAAQLESAIAYGLSAALKGEITIERGRAKQSNFDAYPIVRCDEMPAVEVYFVPSDEAPRGLGEPGVPPIAPAVANAIFAATGVRIRKLPLREVKG